jgi:Gas vesicle synthesis protein GvpL/GvpF
MAMDQYLYAIAERLPRSWRPPAAGVTAAAVAARRVGDLSLITSALEHAPREGPRLLSQHHDVVATTMSAAAVVPFRCGTVLPSDEVDPWLAGHEALLRATLAHVRGRVEMNIRLLHLDWHVSHDRALRSTLDAGGDSIRSVDAGELRQLGERLAERAGAVEWRFRVDGSPRNVAASAAFLLPRDEVGDFLARIGPIASRNPAVAVVPTGPWPPYSFVPTFRAAPACEDLARPATV